MTSKPLPKRHKNILQLLKKGKTNAIASRELAVITGLTSRTVAQTIRELIVTHRVPIIGSRDSSCYGYYIAETQKELFDGTESLYAQVEKEQERLQALSNSDLTEYEKLLNGE